MTFEEVVEEMRVLAGTDAWSFEYEAASYYPQVQIHGYISRPGVGHAQPHNTYQRAIDNMKMKINNPGEIDDPAPVEKEEAA